MVGIPKTQFYLFTVDSDVFLHQTFDSALRTACKKAGSAVFSELPFPETNSFVITYYFPETDKTICIRRYLFTYDENLSLAIPRKGYKEDSSHIEYRLIERS